MSANFSRPLVHVSAPRAEDEESATKETSGTKEEEPVEHGEMLSRTNTRNGAVISNVVDDSRQGAERERDSYSSTEAYFSRFMRDFQRLSENEKQRFYLEAQRRVENEFPAPIPRLTANSEDLIVVRDMIDLFRVREGNDDGTCHLSPTERSLGAAYVRDALAPMFMNSFIDRQNFEDECEMTRVYVRKCFFCTCGPRCHPTDDGYHDGPHKVTCGRMERIAFPFTREDKSLQREWRRAHPNKHPAVANYVHSFRICRNANYDRVPVPREAYTKDDPGVKSHPFLERELRSCCIMYAHTQSGKTGHAMMKMYLDTLLGSNRAIIVATAGFTGEYPRWRRYFQKDFEYVEGKMEAMRCLLPDRLQKRKDIQADEYAFDVNQAFFYVGDSSPRTLIQRMSVYLGKGRVPVYVHITNANNVEKALHRVPTAMDEVNALHFDETTGLFNITFFSDEAHNMFREYANARHSRTLRLHEAAFDHEHGKIADVFEKLGDEVTQISRKRARRNGVNETCPVNICTTTLVTATVNSIAVTDQMASCDVSCVQCPDHEWHHRPFHPEETRRIPIKAYDNDEVHELIACRICDSAKNGQHSNILLYMNTINFKIRESSESTVREVHEKCRRHLRLAAAATGDKGVQNVSLVNIEGIHTVSNRRYGFRFVYNASARSIMRHIGQADRELFIDTKDRPTDENGNRIKKFWTDADGRRCIQGGGHLGDRYQDDSDESDGEYDGNAVFTVQLPSSCHYTLLDRYDLIYKCWKIECERCRNSGESPPNMPHIICTTRSMFKEAISVETTCHKLQPTALIFHSPKNVLSFEKKNMKDLQALIQIIGRACGLQNPRDRRSVGIWLPTLVMVETVKNAYNAAYGMARALVEHAGRADDERTLCKLIEDTPIEGVWGLQFSEYVRLYRNALREKTDALVKNCEQLEHSSNSSRGRGVVSDDFESKEEEVRVKLFERDVRTTIYTRFIVLALDRDPNAVMTNKQWHALYKDAGGRMKTAAAVVKKFTGTKEDTGTNHYFFQKVPFLVCAGKGHSNGRRGRKHKMYRIEQTFRSTWSNATHEKRSARVEAVREAIGGSDSTDDAVDCPCSPDAAPAQIDPIPSPGSLQRKRRRSNDSVKTMRRSLVLSSDDATSQSATKKSRTRLPVNIPIDDEEAIFRYDQHKLVDVREILESDGTTWKTAWIYTPKSDSAQRCDDGPVSIVLDFDGSEIEGIGCGYYMTSNGMLFDGDDCPIESRKVTNRPRNLRT